MPNHLAIQSVANALVTYLKDHYEAAKTASPQLMSLGGSEPRFELLGSSKFSGNDAIEAPRVTLYVHRVTMNQHLRNTRTGAAVAPLGLDVHFLLSVWAASADDELMLLGWAMREIHYHSFLGSGSLAAGMNQAGWTNDDMVSLFPAELTTEEMSRIWESAKRGYRLSHPFIARVVRLSKDPVAEGKPVVATRFEVGDVVRRADP